MSDLAFIDLEESPKALPAKKVALLGPFGDDDAGSQATLAGLLQGLDGIEAVVASAAPHQTSAAHDVQAIDVFDRRSVARAIADSDAIVLTNPVLSASNGRLWRMAALSVRARLSGKPFALVGVSAWGLDTPTSRALARTIVANADLLLLKDEVSADALAEAGVEPPFRIGADPAWAQLDELYAAKEPADQVVVALDTVIDIRDAARFEDDLAATLGPVAASGLDVRIQPWTDGGRENTNVAVAHNVAARLGANADVIESPASLADARDSFSGSRVVLALRLHAVMAAACAGSRALALTDDPTLERLTDALSLPSVPASSDPAVLSAALLDAAESSPATFTAVRQHIDRAKGSIDLVRLLLTEGAAAESAIDPLPLYPNPWRA